MESFASLGKTLIEPFICNKQIKNLQQLMIANYISLCAVAELGGYLGMTLGISLLDTEHLISKIVRLYKKEESNSESKEPTSQIKSGLSSVTMSSVVENVE